MLTRIVIRNFKRLEEIDFELGRAVVLIGPNNSGKTTALQALALWEIGLRQWNAKRQGKSSPGKRPGVTINKNDLIAVPTPSANLLWRGLHVRDVESNGGKAVKTHNVRIDIIVDGETAGKGWTCGLEFDYANPESFYCRPLRLTEEDQPDRMPIPREAAEVRVTLLPPMSGLIAVEPKWEPGRINVLLGEGQTAQVLRNLCYQIHEKSPEEWLELVRDMKGLFGVDLLEPKHVVERGEITMSYRESNCELDLSSSGRGLQQTLLLLAHLYANPRTVLLLDEPDAHLEILRQRQIYHVMTDVAGRQGSQIVAASHSEIVLEEAADQDTVIAFVGKPHRINNRGTQVMKALKDIGWDQYYQAEQTGWVLYLEGPTDLSILRAFAITLSHEAKSALERPFVHYVQNLPGKAQSHFHGLREAYPDLVGIALFDRLSSELSAQPRLRQEMWSKRELENYLCMPDALMAFATGSPSQDMFEKADSQRRQGMMLRAIEEISSALKTLKKLEPWSADVKATDDFLDPLFERYFELLDQPNQLRKTNYHVIAGFVPSEKIDGEVIDKLSAILETSRNAKGSSTT